MVDSLQARAFAGGAKSRRSSGSRISRSSAAARGSGLSGAPTSPFLPSSRSSGMPETAVEIQASRCWTLPQHIRQPVAVAIGRHPTGQCEDVGLTVNGPNIPFDRAPRATRMRSSMPSFAASPGVRRLALPHRYARSASASAGQQRQRFRRRHILLGTARPTLTMRTGSSGSEPSRRVCSPSKGGKRSDRGRDSSDEPGSGLRQSRRCS